MRVLREIHRSFPEGLISSLDLETGFLVHHNANLEFGIARNLDLEAGTTFMSRRQRIVLIQSAPFVESKIQGKYPDKN